MKHTNGNDGMVQAGKGGHEAQQQIPFKQTLVQAVAVVIGALYIVEKHEQTYTVKMETCDTYQFYDCDDDDSDLEGPGKRNSKTGRMANYIRTNGSAESFYMHIINHFNTQMLNQLTGFAAAAFADPFRICAPFITAY